MEVQELAVRCEEDPWTLGPERDARLEALGLQPDSIIDKEGVRVADVYVDEQDRRLERPEHLADEIDDARDIEAMRRLLPKLLKEARLARAFIEDEIIEKGV